MAGVSRRRGITNKTETKGELFVLTATVPLSQMFGYAPELRGITSGQGEFTMEYLGHEPVPQYEADQIAERYKKKIREKHNEK